MNARKVLTNWVALIAILSVALLGVLAIDRSADSRIETQRESLVNLCNRQNTARSVANEQRAKLKETTDVLRGALHTASKGKAHSKVEVRVAYARLQAMLGDPTETGAAIPLIDCEKEIPKP